MPFDMQTLHHMPAGIVGSTIANVNRGQGTPPYPPEQFMPYAKRNEPNVEQQLMSGDW